MSQKERKALIAHNMYSFDNRQQALGRIAHELGDRYAKRKRTLQAASTPYLKDVTRDINPGIQMTRGEMIQQILIHEFPQR